jgi:hypothetical protein
MSAVPGAQGATGAQLLEGQFEMQFGLSLEKDLLSWLGDIAFFAQGNAVSSFGGGAVIQATDPKAAAAAMPKIKAALERAGAPVVPLDLGQFEGFSIQDKGMAEPINFVLADQRVLIVFGDNATLAALGSDPALASDANFTAARDGLGDGFSVAGYLDMARAVSIIDSEIPTDPAYDNDVKPFLEHLSYAVFGSKREGDRLLTRAVIGVK